jgi:hypothetical protein
MSDGTPMHRDEICFAIDVKNGQPFVLTCRGRLHFRTVDDAAAFIAARAHARLTAYKAIWDSFEADATTHHATTRDDRDINTPSFLP